MKPRITPPGWLATACIVSSLAALPVPATGQATAEVYSTVPASADGIGKLYMGREISAVMGFQGAAWLEREEREKEERTDILIDALNLQPGMVVADIGAGTGYLARRMAAMVAPDGKVLAVDVQPEMLRLLERLARQKGVGKIEPRLATERDAMLAAGSVDMAVMVDVYHELAYPKEVLASVVNALKPGGRLVLVEYRAEDPQVPIKRLHKMSEAQVKREVQVHSVMAWERTVGRLPWQHMVVFRKGR